MNDLDLSGERVIEDDYKSSPSMYAIYLMHIASYDFASQYTRGKRVLDLGCGSGYGAARIAETALSVTAVDVSEAAIAYASERYARKNVQFHKVKAGPLPFERGAFDVVLSFQVIEHVMDDLAYVQEAGRVLADNGVMIMVTPNRAPRLFPGQRPWNRWHVREYSDLALEELLKSGALEPQMLYMTARGGVAALELARYRTLKWVTLPFTFPAAPESWRLRGLNWLHKLSERKTQPGARVPPLACSLEDVSIGPPEPDALNLVAVAYKSGR